MKTLWVAAALALSAGTMAHATEFVQNGGFESSSYASNTQFGATYGGQGVTNWTGAGGNHLQFYYLNGTESTTNAVNQFNDPLAYFRSNFVDSPQGKAFVALDGDSDYAGTISQTINGLTVGDTYTLTFDWAASQLANRSGATTEQLQINFGGDTVATGVRNVASEGFVPWQSESFKFKATSTSQVLTFLSIGTPNGQPPIATLDAVSLTGGVPEPATWGLMIMGFAGLGAALRQRRRAAVTVA